MGIGGRDKKRQGKGRRGRDWQDGIDFLFLASPLQVLSLVTLYLLAQLFPTFLVW